MTELLKTQGQVDRIENLDSKNGKKYQKLTIDNGEEHILLFNWGIKAQTQEGDKVEVMHTPGDKYPGRITSLRVMKKAGTDPEGKQETLDELEKQTQEVKPKPHNGNLANSKAYLAMKLASEMSKEADLTKRIESFKALTNLCIILFTEYGE